MKLGENYWVPWVTRAKQQQSTLAQESFLSCYCFLLMLVGLQSTQIALLISSPSAGLLKDTFWRMKHREFTRSPVISHSSSGLRDRLSCKLWRSTTDHIAFMGSTTWKRGLVGLEPEWGQWHHFGSYTPAPSPKGHAVSVSWHFSACKW